MKVVEIFSSIQGEGNFLGISATFIRFLGCNLRCSFCDSKGTWTNGEGIQDLSIEAIIGMVQGFDNNLVVLTGGEPCLQEQLDDLVDILRFNGFFVTVETNGTQATPQADWITCSPKEEAGYNINTLCRINELKYVVTPEFDATLAIPEPIRELYAGKIWLQPEGSDMQNMWKKCFQLAQEDNRLRVGVQLHKLMEVE